MAAFIEDERPSQVVHYLLPPGSGDGQPYLYVTRRPLVADGRVRTLTCIGGVERALAEGARYERAGPCPEAVVRRLHHLAAPIVDSLPRDPRDYAWVWHGLMAYTPHELRVVGADRRQPVLLWNLGCNGVGFLPSIHGGHRVARLLAGERLAPSLFDPR
jgi:glycine/D-amino acid oxidase-like deaminating enzyme